MKVAINNLPLKSGHKFRGIGYYTNNLIEGLGKDESIEVQQFTDLSEVTEADVVHYPWFDLFFHTLPIKRRFPTVITIHDVIPLVFPRHYPVGIRGKINFFLQKRALKSCKYIITDSEISKEDIKKYLKVQTSKIAVIPLAADGQFKIINNETLLLHVKRKYRLPDNFLLYVGDANWVKNLPFLIEGFYKLKETQSLANVKLVLVGGVFLKDVENIDHPELQSLKLMNRLIKQYGLESSIIRTGQIATEELAAFFNLATVYVQASTYEGFGLPILQAFSCGTPVASSNKGSLPEIGGGAAVYFDPANIKQFLSVLKAVLEDRSLQSKLSKLGLAQVQKFSWKKTAEDTKKVYIDAAKSV